MALIGASNSLGGLAGSNSTARLLVVISGTSTPLSTALSQAEGSLSGFGRNANSIGNALTRSLTLPLLAFGAVAVKFASDFQASIARVAGLTPILEEPGQSIEKITDQLLTLARDPQIIAGPKDLADALYFAGSAGLDAATAMEIVELSAKGASIGMGEAADISKVLIFAMNNFGDVGLTAADAMDQLVAAIKTGTAEPEEMAIALGRLLPVAKEANITFGETVAAVAALSNLGVPTRVATTSLRALFSELLAPTIQANEALRALGVTSLELRDALGRGPVEAFELLLSATNGNVEALHDIIPQIRGFTAFLGLTDDQMRAYHASLDAVENSHGALGKAMDYIAASPMFKFQKGLQSLQVAAIELGAKFVPIFNQISQIMRDVGNTVAGLPEPILTIAAAFIGVAAAAGPLTKLYAVLTAVRGITVGAHTAAQLLVPSFKAMGAALGVVAIAGAVAFNGLQNISRGTAGLFTVMTTAVTGVLALFSAFKLLQGAVALAGFKSLSITLAGLGPQALVIAGAITAIGLAMAYAAGQSAKIKNAAKQMGDALLEGAKSGLTLRQSLKAVKDEDIRKDLYEAAKAAGVLNENLADAANLMKLQIGGDLVEGLKALSDERGVSADNLKEFIPVIARAVAEGRDLGPMLKEAGLSGEQFFTVLDMLKSSAPYLSGQIDEVERLAREYPTLIDQTKIFNAVQQAGIEATLDNEAGIERLATKYGVSTDFMRKQLDRFGLEARNVTGEVEEDFAAGAGGVEEAGGRISLAMEEAQAAAAELAATIAEDLGSAFDIFGELPEKVKDFDKLISKAEQLGDLAVSLTTSAQTLVRRGVPTGLLEDIIAQGPLVAKQFADSSDKELRRVVTAYEIAMGAIDAEIIKEKQHQKGKAESMISQFAQTILSSSRLTTEAAGQIVKDVGDEFAKGNLSKAGVKTILTFVNGLSGSAGIGLTKAQGSKAAQAFADGVISGKFVDKSGRILVQKAAQGISQASGITVSAARNLVTQAIAEMAQKAAQSRGAGRTLSNEFVQGALSAKGLFKTTGTELSLQFAEGLSSPAAQAQAEAAALRLAAAARNALDDGLKNSPKYFSYYMGIELGKQLADGFKKGTDDPESRRNTNDAVERLILTLRRALRTSNRLEGIFDELFDNIKEGFKKGLDKADLEMAHEFEKMFKNLDDRLQRLKKRYDNLTSAVREGFGDFKDIIGDFGAALEAYRDANDQYIEDLADYQEALEDYYKTLAEGGEAELPVPPTPPTPVDPQQFLADQLAGAKKLAQVLRQLAKMGLAPALIAQLASQGEAAIPIAEALLAGGQELIDDFNETYADLNKITGNTAELLGEKYFGKAIRHVTNKLDHLANALERFIEQLRSMLNAKAKELDDALAKLANQAGNAGGGGNGTKPPGPNQPGPWNQWQTGWNNWLKDNAAPTGGNRVGNPALIDGRGPVSTTAAPTGGRAITVYVNGWVGSDQQIAAKVRDELLRIDRNNGRIF